MNTLTIGFIGLGLIGGSIAKSIKKFHPNYQVYAYDTSTDTLTKAYQEGVIDGICETDDMRFSQCEFLFLCAPVSCNIQYLKELRPLLHPDCILTDVGSVKGSIHKEITDLHLDSFFIGGHPMTGSEKMGFHNSTDHLLENAYYILTPSSETQQEKLNTFKEFIASLGALPMIMSWKEHDYITAAVSHLPHVVASSLVNLIEKLDSREEHMKTIAAGGFKDLTRIASSSPVMWEQICLTNRENISNVLEEYIDLLEQVRDLVDKGDGAGLHTMFSNSREYRNSMSSASAGPIKKAYVLYCDIVDETGAIATIATTLAMEQISIKNIGIIHNREFEEGVLKVEFYRETDLAQAGQLLRKRNYIIYER